MEELGLVGDLAAVAIAAVIGGALARLLKLPSILGYLAAGIMLGPHTPGPTGDIDEVRTVADLGVALLMFTLGVRFTLRELGEYRMIALLPGLGVTAIMFAAGTAVGLSLGLAAEEAVIAGMIASISSTMVALRLLEDRGLIVAPPGRLALVTALVQDMVVVVYLVLVPVLAGEQEDVAGDLAFALLKGLALLAGLWVVGTFLIPPLLGRIAVSRSRELFLLTLVALALGTASLSFEAGLSLAFGAFLAGLLISESEYAHRAIVEVLPLREVFAVVFFVAIGMLINPDSFVDDPGLVVGIAAVGVLLKVVLIGGSGLLLGFPARAAVPAAIALGNMGEFSFVIASQALDEEIISPEINEALLASVLLSIAVSPILFGMEARLMSAAERLPVLGPALSPRTDRYIPGEERLVNHAIVVGYTQAGREVAAAIELRDFRCVVIDEDPQVFRELSGRGVACILGDASMPLMLEQAGVESARVLVVTLTDPGQIESIAATARQLNRRLDIVARGLTDDAPVRLRELGVSRVVQAEFEVGMQFVRHTLQRFGMTSQEVQALLYRLRQERLGESEPPATSRRLGP